MSGIRTHNFSGDRHQFTYVVVNSTTIPPRRTLSEIGKNYCLNFLFITMGCRPLSSVTSFTQLFHLSLNLLNCVELGILKKVIKLYMSVTNQVITNINLHNCSLHISM
jgi:hypothetical protein